MNFAGRLNAAVERNNSLLAVGLDPQVDKLPAGLQGARSIFKFNRQLIDATFDLVCAYKPNTAFYEAYGSTGIEQLKLTCDYIKDKKVPLIVDAKRADIGSTNDGYAAFIFDYLGADAVTLNPYLGREALQPFLARRGKGMIILCRTSNPGAGEFQDLELSDGRRLYEAVAEQVCRDWNRDGNCLLVVGATYPDELRGLRARLGEEMTFLVPGVGAQGGDVRQTMSAGRNGRGSGLIINAGRSIIYADSGKDFAAAARSAAEALRDEINKYRRLSK